MLRPVQKAEGLLQGSGSQRGIGGTGIQEQTELSGAEYDLGGVKIPCGQVLIQAEDPTALEPGEGVGEGAESSRVQWLDQQITWTKETGDTGG